MKFQEQIKYVPLAMFCSGFIKAMFITPTWTETVVLGVLGAVSFAYQYYADESRFALLHKRADEVDKHLTSLYSANEDVKNKIMGVSVSQGLRSTTIFGNKQ